MVALERLQRLFQRTRGGRDVLQLLRLHVVDVLVQRLARIDLVDDAVESGQQHRREREIRVARRDRGSGTRCVSLSGSVEYIGMRTDALRLRWE